MDCNQDRILLLWSGELSEEERLEAMAHLAECPDCLAMFEELNDMETAVGEIEDETAPMDFVTEAEKQGGDTVVPFTSILRKPIVMYPSLGGLAAAAAIMLMVFGPWADPFRGSDPMHASFSSLATYSTLKESRVKAAKYKYFSKKSSFQARTGKVASRIRMAKRSIGRI